MCCTSKIKLTDQGCGLINNATFVIKLQTCNYILTLNEDDVEIFYFTHIQNKYWQTFLYEYKHVWYTTTNGVTCENAKSSSKLLSMSTSKQIRPEQCITTAFKYKASQQKKHTQFLVHVQFSFVYNKNYFYFN